jgi:hypothetical protein
MLLFIGFIESGALERRVRQQLTDTFGCSATHCAGCTTELRRLCAAHPDVYAIITDLPSGKPLTSRYDEIRASAGDHPRIVIINNATANVIVPSGERTFTIVPEAQLESTLRKMLRNR